MLKKLTGAVLALALLLTLAVPAFAQTGEEAPAEQPPVPENTVFLEIATAEEFLRFAENCRLDSYSVGLVVTLKSSIDLSGTDFACIPTFSGFFDGGGHTVSGVEIRGDGSYQGLFRYLTATASVKDLTVKGAVCPGGSAIGVGGIAGHNQGQIQNCSAVIEVSGSSYVGGIAGINGITGLIEDCSVRGQVDGAHFVGGIAGENMGVIRRCVNSALVNNSSGHNTLELSDITLETITDSEASNTATDIGGVAGLSTGVIRDCSNKAQVGYPHMGFNVGGIAGTQSGHIADCVNEADVRGRKEVGGIVGQMEPIAYVEFSTDTLQILKEQLGTMSSLVDKAAVNAGGGAGAMSGQIGALQNQANTAWEAVETLLTTDKTDTDALLAAQNTLTSTLGQMPDTVNRIAGAAQAMVGGLSRDFKIISEHIGVMSQTLNEATENMGGSITDVSDMDASDIVAGKVLCCENEGAVSGDLNVGGIAGAMSFENDMDVLEDWDFTGEESMNFDSKIRAVILSCENHGTVTGGKQHVGGIVGWQALGLVRSSLNTGKVDGTGAEYVGGISGYSIGFIRYSSAKGEVLGESCVGGIAGSATVVTDSVAAVRILEAREKYGAILGIRQEADEQEQTPVSGNYYLAVDGDYGAVDGISYDGQAQPVTLEEFKMLERLPAAFRRVTVRFVFEDGTAEVFILAPGEALSADRIPPVPEKAGMSGRWDGLQEADLDHVLYDMTFALYYEGHAITLASESVDEGRPLLLAEGLFGLDAALALKELDASPALSDGEALLGCWEPVPSGETRIAGLRCLLPETEDPDRLRLLVLDDRGQWRQETLTLNGSYGVFAWQEGDRAYALIQGAPDYTLWYLAGGGAAAVILIAAVALIRSRKKKNVSLPTEEPEAPNAEEASEET